MSEIKKVAILGAGAMGSAYAAMFFDAAKHSTELIARGQRYDRLKSKGLVVNGKHYVIPVTHPDEATSPADLILVALKHHHLSDAVEDLNRLVDSHTTVLSVMNGLDSEEVIGSIYGMDKLVYAISVGIDAVRRGNEVTYTNPGKIFFGEADNTNISQRVRRVQAAFDHAGIVHETPTDMIRMMWWKFMVNVGMNQASAVMRAPYGVFQSSPDAQGLMEALMREVIMLADAAGVNLGKQDLENWYTFLNSLSPLGKTSMLQDIEAARKTEVDVFAGKVIELGRTHAIPTPVNQAMLQVIRVTEQHPSGVAHMMVENQINRLELVVQGLERCVLSLTEEGFLTEKGHWSTRDILAHLVGWNRYVIEGSKQIKKGELPFYDVDPGENYSKVNAEHISKYPSSDRKELLDELQTSARELKQFLQSLDAEAWDRDYGVKHQGSTLTIRSTVDDLIGDYDHHIKQIKEWEKRAAAR